MPQIFLLAGTTTWTVPDDCVSAVIDTIGAGSGGDAVGGGGGGGAWARSILPLTPRAVINVAVGLGGTSGNPGGDTWFNATSLANAVTNGATVSCAAEGADAPITTAGGAGGDAAGSVGTSVFSGGNGGSVATGNPGGGGGAAGPNGNGGAGSSGGVSLGGNGGQGDNGFGGTGGAGAAAATNPGNPGTEYDASHGSGGGGGSATTVTAGAGGNYGGGGGGGLTAGGAGTSGLIIINYVSAFANKRRSPNYDVGFDDASVWQASTPKAFNLSLAVANVFAKTVLRPPFYVSRPADDFIWQTTLDNRNANIIQDLTAVRFFGAGGQAPTQRGKFDYNIAESAWQGPIDNYNSNILDDFIRVTFFGAPGQAPTKRWRYDYDISESFWNQGPINSATLRGLTAQKVFGAGGQVPTKRSRFDYDVGESVWQGASIEACSSASIQLLTETRFFGAGGQVPTKRWRLDYDVAESVWVGTNENYNSSILFLPSVPQTPFKAYQQTFVFDDGSAWQQSNALGAATFYTLLNAPTFKTVLRPPFIVPRPADDFIWQQPPSRNAQLLATNVVATPFTYTPWKFGQDEASTWQFKAPYNFAVASSVQFPSVQDGFYNTPDDTPTWQQPPARNARLLVPTVVNPFVIPSWKFGVDDASGWQSGARAKNINLVPAVVNEPFIYTPWKFGHDDSSGWQYGSKARNINLVPVVNEPFIYTPWQFGNEDASAWPGRSTARNINLVPVVSEPFIYKPWEFGQDDSSGWQFGPKSNTILTPIVTAGGQPPTPRWHYDYDVAESAWLILPRGRNPNLVTIIEPTVNLPWLWKFSSDDSSGWQFSSKGSGLLVPIATAGGQTSAPLWKFVTRPLDDPFWQFVGQVNVNVTNRPKIVNPPILNWTFNTATDDAPAWQGFYWRNNNILFPTAVLTTDPRFVCSPNAPNRTLPSNLGSARNFVTTPISRFPSMPYGNDFSVIDPTVEQVTGTFNFDPWLALGETVVAIISITVTNSNLSLVQDPNPQAIVFGTPMIGPVPPAFPGTPSGAPNRAVLQQFSNCQSNVLYLAQCLVLTSNNQKLNLACHMPCGMLN